MSRPAPSSAIKAVEAACYAYEGALLEAFRVAEAAHIQAVTRVEQSEKALDGVKNRITRKVLEEDLAEDNSRLATTAYLLEQAHKQLTNNLGSIKNDTIKAAQAHDINTEKIEVMDGYPRHLICNNKGRFLFRNLKKNGSNLEREILKFVKNSICKRGAWCRFADEIEDFSLGFIGEDFTGVIEIPLDKVRRFRVIELQDYELETIGAELYATHLHDGFDLNDYWASELLPYLDEEKFKALYGAKIGGCGHGALAEMEPDKVQECLNEMVGKPVKIFDQGRCGICLEQERLFALSCGCAVFCQGCVVGYVKSSQKKCPICRKGFTLAECCQSTKEYEFSVEGIRQLMEANDDRGLRECLDFRALARAIGGTDNLIERAQESYLNCVEVGADEAQADFDKGFTYNGVGLSTGGYYLCFEEIVDE